MPTPDRAEPRLARTPSGRAVAYDVHGEPDGAPVLYLHGVPSSRLEVHVFGLPAAARAAGVRLVALDRAGVGRSGRRPGGSLLGTAEDVAAVADDLGLPAFALLGYSAGTPSALAAAAAMRSRVTALGLVSGIGPGDRPDLVEGRSPDVARVFRLARSHPRALAAGLHFMRYGTRRPDRLVAAVTKDAPAADAAVLERSGAPEAFARFLAEAFRAGVTGVREDFQRAAGPWPFDLQALTMPVHLWHGDLDRNAPVRAIHWLTGQLPGAVLTTSARDGHASLITTRGQDILATLARA